MGDPCCFCCPNDGCSEACAHGTIGMCYCASLDHCNCCACCETWGIPDKQKKRTDSRGPYAIGKSESDSSGAVLLPPLMLAVTHQCIERA